jgi:hypothetical protein
MRPCGGEDWRQKFARSALDVPKMWNIDGQVFAELVIPEPLVRLQATVECR